MKHMLVSGLVVCLALSACGGQATPDPAEVARLVAQAVKATVAAMPTPEPQTIEVEKIVKETVIVEVTAVREVVVTATPIPEPLSPTPTQQQAVEVGDTIIFAHKEYDESNRLDVFALVENPNLDWWLPSSLLTVSVFNEAGDIIGTDQTYVVVGPAGKTPVIVSGINLADQTHHEVVIQLSPDEMKPVSKWPNVALAVVQANVVGDRLVGQIENTGEARVPQTQVIIVVTNAAGDVVAIPWGYAAESQPGQIVPFDQWDSVFAEPGVQFEIFLQPELVAGTW